MRGNKYVLLGLFILFIPYQSNLNPNPNHIFTFNLVVETLTDMLIAIEECCDLINEACFEKRVIVSKLM